MIRVRPITWRWFPWRAILRRVARRQGILDPVVLLTRLGRFGKPSEVQLPTELLRMGISLHARGLINNQAIQHNLDWVWPYWVEHQFDPADEAFIPRAFSLTHINLTHRNWTALGLPSSAEMPLVDPAGLVTPLLDGWSLDGWVVPGEGRPLLPSCCAGLRQSASTAGNLSVSTAAMAEAREEAGEEGGIELRSRARVERLGEELVCRVTWSVHRGPAGRAADGAHRVREAPAAGAGLGLDMAPGAAGAQGGDGRGLPGGWLVISVRPYNPEGVSFIQHLNVDPKQGLFRVNRKGRVWLEPVPARYRLSNYSAGDVFHSLSEPEDRLEIDCDVGMATAAALFPLRAGGPAGGALAEVTATVPLEAPGARVPADERVGRKFFTADIEWDDALEGACAFQAPEERYNELYRLALRAVVLHTPLDVYPGPFTYKRFWFRDAAFILHALLGANLIGRVENSLQRFFPRQAVTGYFHSQEGEWDANGEVLWLLCRFCELAGRKPPQKWWNAVRRGAEWIRRKRLAPDLEALHAGLLPAGFSAEHFGPNDFYFWDDFWSAAGLQSAARLAGWLDRPQEAAAWLAEARSLLQSVDRTLERVAERLGAPIVPASPYRRMDSGAIGSLAAGYPLQLWGERDERLLGTVEYLLAHCLHKGAFFHDMSHSGLNPYLTLHLAQVLLRAGDRRYFDLVSTVAQTASATGQWPEAIHPRTMGGCMGDGQHIWAAAEWVMMMRSLFLREEGRRLVLCPGLPARWLRPKAELLFGPTPTPFGRVTVRVGTTREKVSVSCQGEWFEREPELALGLPGSPGEVTLESIR